MEASTGNTEKLKESRLYIILLCWQSFDLRKMGKNTPVCEAISELLLWSIDVGLIVLRIQSNLFIH